MFIGICGDETDGGKLITTRASTTFSEAAARVESGISPVVVEWSRAHGWLAFWERVGDRFELVTEAPMAERFREVTRERCPHPFGGDGVRSGG